MTVHLSSDLGEAKITKLNIKIICPSKTQTGVHENKCLPCYPRHCSVFNQGNTFKFNSGQKIIHDEPDLWISIYLYRPQFWIWNINKCITGCNIQTIKKNYLVFLLFFDFGSAYLASSWAKKLSAWDSRDCLFWRIICLRLSSPSLRPSSVFMDSASAASAAAWKDI